MRGNPLNCASLGFCRAQPRHRLFRLGRSRNVGFFDGTALAKGPSFGTCSSVVGHERLWWRFLLDPASASTSSATRFLDRLFPKFCQCAARRHQPGGQSVRQSAQWIHWLRPGNPLGFALRRHLKPCKSIQRRRRLERSGPLFRHAKRFDGKRHHQRPRHQWLSFASRESLSHDSSWCGRQSAANHLLEDRFHTRHG